MQYNTDSINHLIRNRRSVFPDQFDAGRPIPDEIIEAILTNATWAPTHGQNEPWHFSVFTGNGLKQLASFQSELYRQESGSGFAEKKYHKLQQQPLKASHIISIGMKRAVNTRIPEIEDIEAVACAVQNIYLSVTAYDLGGYWTTGGITYYENAKSFFGLGEADKLLGFFYIGYVAIPSAKGRRADVHTKANWIRE
ncbi:nitroreductase [Agriterribacter sp.]|mgnify:CR=1 FL=1|uniref:nitroreductase family protein n=1 Tax=Agriterribacter sp. TaxID=2821509 RepID=UPI002B59800E|nr:nitroreductase [Agriterribacter sp.]HRO46607.1 nitroreductase [Agriterribacter sp.]